MTILDNPNNILFDAGGANEFTFSTSHVEEVGTKTLRIIAGVVGKNGRPDGIKPTKSLDLLRVILRFNVRGLIEEADKTKFINLYHLGGPMTMLWDGATYLVNIEKYSYVKDDRDSSDRPLNLTLVEGNDL